jgi:hypothetical protein
MGPRARHDPWLILTVTAFLSLSIVRPAELDGVHVPEARMVGGVQMRLNGIGLRATSVLGIRIYVAVSIWSDEAITPT